MARKTLSPKLRFDVFERDSFTCQYCGRRPPEVVLEIDHVIALANGGTDDKENLLTACVPCNRGKGTSEISSNRPELQERVAEAEAREAQVAALERFLRKRRSREAKLVKNLALAWDGLFEDAGSPDWTLSEAGIRSLEMFVKRLPEEELFDAIEVIRRAIDRGMTHDRLFKYFCGVCWKKIRGEES